MSLLNGGLVKAKHIRTMDDFVDQFVLSVTDQEWQICAMIGGAGDLITLVSLVAAIRTAPEYPLGPDHPLNPASRYDKAAA